MASCMIGSWAAMSDPAASSRAWYGANTTPSTATAGINATPNTNARKKPTIAIDP
jgi:hypothetical protein